MKKCILTQMAIERPELIRIISNNESDLTAQTVYTYLILNTFAHMFHMGQRKVVSDNEWTGWLRVMNSCFDQGKIREYWESDLELEKWFDPAMAFALTIIVINPNQQYLFLRLFL
jgi:hypothetical protein